MITRRDRRPGVMAVTVPAHRTLNRWAARLGAWHLASLVLVIGLLGPGSAGAVVIEAERIFERPLDVWFGTLSVVGAAAPSQDFVALSDRVTQGIRSGIDIDATADARVKNLPDSLMNFGQTNSEWVLGQNPPPDNFPAQQNLLDAYAAAALDLDGLFGPGNLTLLNIVATESNYLLTNIETTEPAPATVGTPGNPVVVGGEGDTVVVSNQFWAQARFFERNAVWSARTATVPEPGTLMLLCLGLAGIGLSGASRSGSSRAGGAGRCHEARRVRGAGS